MALKKISIEIQEKANKIIEDFNNAKFKNKKGVKYFAKYKGSFLYIHRAESDYDSPVCRLKYTGNFEDWEFAIFKFSSETYDPDEFIFPGAKHVDGTILGALRAGHEAYPPSWAPSSKDLIDFVDLISKFGNFKKP